jgi:hypothetical protein
MWRCAKLRSYSSREEAMVWSDLADINHGDDQLVWLMACPAGAGFP